MAAFLNYTFLNSWAFRKFGKKNFDHAVTVVPEVFKAFEQKKDKNKNNQNKSTNKSNQNLFYTFLGLT